jgi:hypothetical protein
MGKKRKVKQAEKEEENSDKYFRLNINEHTDCLEETTALRACEVSLEKF